MILRKGEINELVRNRSVEKRLSLAGIKNEGKNHRENHRENESSCGMMTQGEEVAGMMAAIKAMNCLAAKGIRPEKVEMSLLLPDGTEEEFLRFVVDEVALAGKKADCGVSFQEIQISDAVTRPGAFAYSVGHNHYFDQKRSLDCSKGSSIFLVGRIGLGGTFLLVHDNQRRKDLSSHFPSYFLQRTDTIKEMLSIIPTLEAMEIISKEVGIVPQAMISLGDGGLEKALWDLSLVCGCGFEVNLLDVPILQETIELTEYEGINPYALQSTGGLLAVMQDENHDFVNRLAQLGFFAAQIGKLTKEKDKVFIVDGKKQYLNRPAADSLLFCCEEDKQKRRRKNE